MCKTPSPRRLGPARCAVALAEVRQLPDGLGFLFGQGMRVHAHRQFYRAVPHDGLRDARVNAGGG